MANPHYSADIEGSDDDAGVMTPAARAMAEQMTDDAAEVMAAMDQAGAAMAEGEAPWGEAPEWDDAVVRAVLDMMWQVPGDFVWEEDGSGHGQHTEYRALWQNAALALWPKELQNPEAPTRQPGRH